MTFLAVAGLLAAALAVSGILVGLCFWWACEGDIRRCRDWHTVAAPVLLRIGVLALVLLPGAFGLYHLVDGAGYDSWLYGD
ncbi:DUF6336 family protein [Streptomyces sp. NPDC093594]|uniref:DUF6336 family protein n=1 Tax=Streptomyces sp. NPDC093594 TaxID=3155305 RepID=UPI00344DF67C